MINNPAPGCNQNAFNPSTVEVTHQMIHTRYWVKLLMGSAMSSRKHSLLRVRELGSLGPGIWEFLAETVGGGWGEEILKHTPEGTWLF